MTIESRLQFDNFLRVGPSKPLGYLPSSYIQDEGYSLKELSDELEAKGLRTAIFSARRLGRQMHQAALYAWDENTLAQLLSDNIEVLTRYEWPSDPDDFVYTVATRKADKSSQPELFALIATAFDDPRHPFSGSSSR